LTGLLSGCVYFEGDSDLSDRVQALTLLSVQPTSLEPVRPSFSVPACVHVCSIPVPWCVWHSVITCPVAVL
jgi:hypothetical protein